MGRRKRFVSDGRITRELLVELLTRKQKSEWTWPERITNKRACGCEFISERDPIVRKGYELGGYLWKVCAKHSPAPVTQKDKA